jgi:hypothetical protein
LSEKSPFYCGRAIIAGDKRSRRERLTIENRFRRGRGYGERWPNGVDRELCFMSQTLFINESDGSVCVGPVGVKTNSPAMFPGGAPWSSIVAPI